ncbi:MAG TPA: SDR family oxidoreductase [Pyrinomonadaceae bacterium]
MLRDETIFLTGFPGFIAGRLLRRLAAEGARFLLLVQPALAQRAREEVESLARETNLPLNHFRILEGDITRDDLSLSAAGLEAARAETTVIFHLAAVYDLAVGRDVAVRVNLEGTRNVNRFAQSVKALRRYHYVSTCYVAGRREGPILETELRHEAGFRNFYEETKYLAEIEVDALKSELPVTIHRPAVVCGDSRTGETAKYDGVYYLILYLLKAPRLLSLLNIGNSDVSLNLVPVDFVVEAMTELAQEERAAGQTVQLADPDPLTTRELFDTLARTMAGRESYVRLPSPLVHFSLTQSLSPKITGLPRPGVPYFFIRQQYDTTQARALLEPRGVRCPPFHTYAKALVDFAAQHPKL